MSSGNARGQGAPANGGQSPYQEQLLRFCESRSIRPPTYQVVSDRRGGRTAWSCTVQIQGQQFPARFWYDGQYVNNAREDASQMALQRLGQLPPSGVTPSHLQQGQQSNQSQQTQNQQNQSGQGRGYGSTSS